MNKHKSYLLFLFSLLLIFPLAACSNDGPATAVNQMPPPHVNVVKIQRGDQNIVGEYMGKALGFLSVEVRAQISGILLSKHYKEGDFVKQGQLLFVIDDSQAKAALNQAKALQSQAQSSYNNARREWDRILPLYNKNAVSQRDRDAAQTAYQSAEANLEATKASVDDAQIRLAYTKVIAPISGYTSLETRNEGNLITLDSQGSLLTVINQTDPMYVSFSLPGSEISRLTRLTYTGKATIAKEGAKASLSLLDGSTYPEEGRVTFIDTQIDPTTNVLHARAEFANPRGALLPNMYARVSLSGSVLNDIITIPQQAVLQTAQGPMVYLVDAEKKVHLTPVVLGDAFKDIFLVEKGLKDGDLVVVEGTTKIHPDMVVVPVIKEEPKDLTTDGPFPIAPNDADTNTPAQAQTPAI